MKNYLSLTYHGLSNSPDGSWEMTPKSFHDDIKLLKQCGYHFLSFDDIQYQSIPEKSVFITFDDGLFSFYKFALDIIVSEKVPCCLFPSTAPIYRKNPNYLSFGNLVEISNIGLIDIGTHGHIHADFRFLTPEQHYEDLLTSIHFLMLESGVTPKTYAFPFNKHTVPMIHNLIDFGFTDVFVGAIYNFAINNIVVHKRLMRKSEIPANTIIK